MLGNEGERPMHTRFLTWLLLLLMTVGFSLAPAGASVSAHGQSVAQPPMVDARIEIVWPHDHQGNPDSAGTLVNVEVDLFERGTLNPVPCTFANQVTLRWAQNWTSHVGLTPSGVLIPIADASPGSNEAGSPGQFGVRGQRILRQLDGKIFPAWIFNDVPVEKYGQVGGTVTTYFIVEIEGADYRTNVWAHSPTPNTFLPGRIPPKAVALTPPGIVDALIPIVWPHDSAGNQQPVAQATLVNVGVDLAQHPSDMGHSSWTSVDASFNRTVRLLRALNNGYLEPVKPADQVITMTNPRPDFSIAWPRWVFNNVDVSAARDSSNKYYFAVEVEGIPTHTVIWTHGADARTYFPQRDIPATSGAECQ